MSRRDGAMSKLRAGAIITGVRLTATGVLLIGADITATDPMRVIRMSAGHWPARRENTVPITAILPVRSSAAPRINMQAIVTRAALPKTLGTSEVERTSVANKRRRLRRRQIPALVAPERT